jgi:prolyl 4-hydroxylase
MSRGDGAGHKFARVALLLVLLSLIAAPGHGRRLPTPRDEERLIGWQGETHDSRVKGSGASLSDDAQSDLERGYWAEPVSWYPRAFHLHNVMSGEECDQFLTIAEPKVRRSTVIDSVTGESKVDPIRTSEQTFLNRGVFDVVTEIEERLARITMLPSYHGEDMQVLRYHIGEKYDAHHDVGELSSKSGAALAAEGGHRVATVLLYLSDVEEGGETAFPDSEWIDQDMAVSKTGPWSECAEGKVAVKPKKGDGLLFWSVSSENKIDPKSMHAGCPVIKGTKWTATKWIHARPFRWIAPPPPQAPPGCDNKHDTCKAWANAGECRKNPKFMLEDCRWGCKACSGMANEGMLAEFGINSDESRDEAK